MDLDGVNLGLTKEGFITSFDYKKRLGLVIYKTSYLKNCKY